MTNNVMMMKVTRGSSLWLVFMWFVFMLFGCSSDKETETPVFGFSPEKITLAKNETTATLKITSNQSWSIKSDKTWCQVTPDQGTGDQDVKITCTGEAIPGDLKAVITVVTEEKEYKIDIIRSGGNGLPAAAVLVAPENESTDVCVLPSFDWKESTDEDGDELTYTLCYSTDKTTWKECLAGDKINYMVDVPLKTSTKYYWKVVTKDADGGMQESEVRSFTTSAIEAYLDGEKFQYQAHSKGKRGVRLVILGDGFLPRDFVKGAAFDKTVKRAVDGLFSAEPFKTYRDYFDIYQVAAYSREEGASIVRPGSEMVIRDTRFNARFVEGSAMKVGDGIAGDNKVYDFVKVTLNITDDALKETIIILISNFDMYGGSCYMNTDKKTIAICANSTKGREEVSGIWRDLEHLVCHEAGGHAFGLLADEYANEGNESTAIPDKELASVKEFVVAGAYGNIDLTKDPAVVKWNHFIGRPGYEAVGVYEGGHEYGKGVWRAEVITCMDNNAWYYSAPAREAIVRRIMQLSGEKFNMDEFYARDVVKAYPY